MPIPAIQSMTQSCLVRARAWFLPQRRGPRISDAQAVVIRSYLDRAEARIRLAGDEDSGDSGSITVGLLRDAALGLLQAVDRARGQSNDPVTPADPVQVLDELGPPEVGDSPEADRVRAALRAPDALAFDRMPAADLVTLGSALHALIRRLRARIDLRSDAYLRGLGILRIAAVLLVVIYGLYAISHRVFAEENLARARPVEASSRQPGTPDPSEVVDGVISGKYGVHTQVGGTGTAWVVVDLGKERDVRRIVVYNRGDTHFDDGLPFTLSLSTDGKTYVALAKREVHFGNGDLLSPPWTVECHTRARYVRVEAHGYLVLREIEVFGKR
jgi:hypothetical protein